jgi:hypothetical protein
MTRLEVGRWAVPSSRGIPIGRGSEMYVGRFECAGIWVDKVTRLRLSVNIRRRPAYVG